MSALQSRLIASHERASCVLPRHIPLNSLKSFTHAGVIVDERVIVHVSGLLWTKRHREFGNKLATETMRVDIIGSVVLSEYSVLWEVVGCLRAIKSLKVWRAPLTFPLHPSLLVPPATPLRSPCFLTAQLTGDRRSAMSSPTSTFASLPGEPRQLGFSSISLRIAHPQQTSYLYSRFLLRNTHCAEISRHVGRGSRCCEPLGVLVCFALHASLLFPFTRRMAVNQSRPWRSRPADLRVLELRGLNFVHPALVMGWRSLSFAV